MAKKIANLFGIVFILVGLLGFFNNPILGIFAAGTIHSIVHLLSGIALLAFANSKNPGSAAMGLKIVGIVYLLVTILGFIMIGSNESVNLLGLIDVNHADNWLHLVLSLVMIWAGFSGGKKMMMSSSSAM